MGLTIEQARDRFLVDLSRRSGNTRRAYDLAIRQVIAFVGEGFPLENLTAEIVLGAIRAINVRGVSYNTMAAYISGISRFLRWSILEGIAPFTLTDLERLRDRMNDLAGSKPNHLPDVPTDDAVAAVIAAARSVVPTTERLAIIKARDVAILEALRSTAARVGEIVALKVGDLIAADRMAIVTGKGDKQRPVLFDAAAWTALQNYLWMRPDDAEGEAPLLCRYDRNATGKVLPLSTTAVRNIVDLYAAMAGVEHLHPHAFRHRAATKLMAAGGLEVAQDALGHVSPVTTRAYARLMTGKLRAAHDAAGL